MEIGQNAYVIERGNHNELPLRFKLLLNIWWLANKETFRQVADRFGTSRGKLQTIQNLLLKCTITLLRQEMLTISQKQPVSYFLVEQ